MRFAELEPDGVHNRALEANVHPADYTNPTPAGRYNLVVIGGGTAGLVTAAGAAGLGAKVALVERRLMGGDCLNVGCIPSKAIIAAARAAAAVRSAGEFGVHVPEGVRVDFAAVMERMRKLRASISPHDSVRRFVNMGVDVFLGEGAFVDGETIEVDGKQLKFKRAVIATGARASAPPIPGLEEIDYLTNETLFSLTELPKRLGIIGGGPIGCEMAQAFARFGSEVFLAEATERVLPREDPAASKIIEAALKRDGVHVLYCGKDLQLAKLEGNRLRMWVDSQTYHVEVDQLLVSAGRAPNIEGLGLENAGVEVAPEGVVVNDRLQTSNKHIYAAGDICSSYQFTHAADFMARIVIRNALFAGNSKFSKLVIPWSTYTDPEIAHVGLTPERAEEQGIAIDTFTLEFGDLDRAVVEGETDGLVRVHVKKGTAHIVGASVVSRNAGDLISELTMAMTHRLDLKQLADVIHPYPTRAEAIRKTCDLYNRSRLTPWVKSLISRWLSWTRR